jgi:hypothetical protein
VLSLEESLCFGTDSAPILYLNRAYLLIDGRPLVSWILASSDVDDAIIGLRIDVRFQPVRSGRFLHT